ncbi:MAG: hypothetical protein R3Y28_00890 [Candidatus Gastranaerophilales bacterium]
MKKIVFILALIIGLRVEAFQDYVISSELPVLGVFSEDSDIVDLKPITTIDNEKKFIVMKVKSEGKVVIHIKTEDKNNKFSLNIKSDGVHFRKKKGFVFNKIDLPPENMHVNGVEILRPPTIDIRGGK